MLDPPAEEREVDEVTLARAQRGDEGACRALVLRYQDQLFRFLSRVHGPRRASGVVADLAQETFLRVFRQLPTFSNEGPARLSTWILTIATRVSIDHLRKRAPESVASERAEQALEALPAPTHTDQDLESEEAAAVIAAAVAALPAEWRAVLLLRVEHDLEYGEIAQALGIQIGTVRSRLARARASVWQALAEQRRTP